MTDTPEENTLILKAQAGDLAAEEEITEKYLPLSKAIARSFNVSSEADVDDLNQIAAIALVKALRTYDCSLGKATFKTYAAKCMTNAVITHLRKQKDAVEPLDEAINVQGSVDPVDYLFGGETYDALIEKISLVLTDREKAVLSLFITAMSYEEISEKLDIEKKQVDNAIYSLRKKIKKIISSDNAE